MRGLQFSRFGLHRIFVTAQRHAEDRHRLYAGFHALSRVPRVFVDNHVGSGRVELHRHRHRTAGVFIQMRESPSPSELGTGYLLQRRLAHAAFILLHSGRRLFRRRSDTSHGYDTKAASGPTGV